MPRKNNPNPLTPSEAGKRAQTPERQAARIAAYRATVAERRARKQAAANAVPVVSQFDRFSRANLTDAQRFHVGQAEAARFSPAALRHMRTDAGLTQSVIADALGRNPDVIRRWEHGESMPSAEDCLRYMVACGVNEITEALRGV